MKTSNPAGSSDSCRSGAPRRPGLPRRQFLAGAGAAGAGAFAASAVGLGAARHAPHVRRDSRFRPDHRGSRRRTGIRPLGGAG